MPIKDRYVLRVCDYAILAVEAHKFEAQWRVYGARLLLEGRWKLEVKRIQGTIACALSLLKGGQAPSDGEVGQVIK